MDITQDAIAALDKQIAKVQHGYENDLYSASQAKEKIDNLRAQIRSLEAKRENVEERAARHARIMARREEELSKLDLLPVMFTTNDPKKNNTFLREFLVEIRVTPEHTFTFEWR